MLKQIMHNDTILAIIITSDYKEEGVSFFTPNDFSQQLAYMKHPAGKFIEPHVHNHVHREVHTTQEVLFIKKGRLRVDFYSYNEVYLESFLLGAGDVILLVSGGHGFEVVEDLEMFEVKQGPYVGIMDKKKFEAVNIKNLEIK